MIVRGEFPIGVADELVAVEVSDDGRVQLPVADHIMEPGKPRGQFMEHVTKGFRVDLDVGHTRPLARNTEEFNVHAGRKLMIALSVTPTFQ